MADKILLYHGPKAELPELLPNEPGFCTDTFELLVGTSEQGNKLVGSVVWGESINTLSTSLKSLEDSLDSKLTASRAESVGTLAAEATTADLVTAFNDLVAKLKAAGIMKT